MFSETKVRPVRESKTVLDSEFHAMDSAFLELYSGFQRPGVRIPQRKFDGFWIPQVTRNDHMILHELEIPRHSLVCYNFPFRQKN